MFIKTTNLSSGNEININTDFVVSFQGANDGKASLVVLSTGDSYVIDMSNRSLRFALKKDKTSAEPAEA